MQIKTILNQVQKFKSFVYGKTQPGIAEIKKVGFLKIACIIMMTTWIFRDSKNFFEILFEILSEGRISDYKRARSLIETLPSAPLLPADRGHDADWLREAPRGKGVEPSGKNRGIDIPYNKALYKHRHKIESMFANLEDWRRIATRYDSVRTHFLLRYPYRRYRHIVDSMSLRAWSRVRV
uniref:Transposase n=2 Tax=Candidatus Kentrum sp. TC TaxID=2126339 RepID=A0A450ZTC6_9GAMM|nr:MAG: Transposase [Candidatus Kentron sp. TC]